MLRMAAKFALDREEAQRDDECGYCGSFTESEQHAPWCLARLVDRGRWAVMLSRPDTNDATPLCYTAPTYAGLVSHAAAALRGTEADVAECVTSLSFELPQSHKAAEFGAEVAATVARVREAEPARRARADLNELRSQLQADLVTPAGYKHFYMLLCARHGTARIDAINKELEPLP